MARIRIVDEWLRSPVSRPVRHRMIMVVAETWAEQKVLMRAFASCLDQTQPTIGLQGREIAISPAGTDPHGPWGVHVMPPLDGRAQELRELLAVAARRLAGSKGNPPRLQDELSAEERKPTSPYVGPGASLAAGGPPPPAAGVSSESGPDPGAGGQWSVASVAPDDRTVMPPWASQGGVPGTPPDQGGDSDAGHGGPRAGVSGPSEVPVAPEPGPSWTLPAGSSPRFTPPPRRFQASHSARARRARRRTQQPPQTGGSSTAFGHTPMNAPVPERRSYHQDARQQPSLATVVGKTMPIGFQISPAERAVLDALSRGDVLDDSQVKSLAAVADPADFMSRLAGKLAGHGLDLIHRTPAGYTLRRG